MSNIRDTHWFLTNRNEQYKAAVEIADHIKNKESIVVLYGLLKSGKREVVEILALILKETYEIIYSTSLSRKDMKPQFEEFEQYGISTLCLTKRREREIKGFDVRKNYIVIFDEDYGDNEEQQFESFYKKYKGYNNVNWLFTTATPFAILDALNYKSTAPIVTSETNMNYMHIHDMNIVEIHSEALMFHKSGKGKNEQTNFIGFTQAFKNILDKWLAQDKCTKFIIREQQFQDDMEEKMKEKLREFQLERKINPPKVNFTLVDCENSYKWMKDNWSDFELIIVKQTFTRGTETNIHPYLFGYYDHRTNSSALNTLLQALGRFAGYHTNKNINLYLSKDGINAVEANKFFEKSMKDKVDFSTIKNTLHHTYGIKKFSLNTVASINVNSSGTWSYTRVDESQIGDGHKTNCDKGTKDKVRVLKSIVDGTAADGAWISESDIRCEKDSKDKSRVLQAIADGAAAAGVWKKETDAWVTIIDIEDIIKECESNSLYPNDSTYILKNKLALEHLSKVEEKYGPLPRTGEIRFKASLVSAPKTEIVTKNTSAYIKL